MADILTRLNQAQNVTESTANLIEVPRALGWAQNEKVLVFIEKETGSDSGVAFTVASTVGPGQGRRITKSGHGFHSGQPLRLVTSGGMSSWTLAQAMPDGSKNATHMVVAVIDDSTFDVASVGAWSLSLYMNAGTYYLSEVPGQLTTNAPAFTGQVVGMCDGTSLFLTLGSAASSNDKMSFKGEYDSMKSYIMNDVVTYKSSMYIAIAAASAGAIPSSSMVWTLISTKTSVPASASVLGSDVDGNVVESVILDENNAAYPTADLGPGVKATKIAIRTKMVVPNNLFENVDDVITSGTFTLTLKSQTAGTFFGAPASAAGTPTWRSIVPTDLGSSPTISKYLRGDGTWSAPVASEVGGLAAIATSGSATDLIAGTVPAARFPALTGDVTSTSGTVTTAIASTVVTGKVLTGYAVGTNTAIVATDTILQAFGKLQAEISARQDNSASQAANTVHAAPNGSAGAPTWRLLVAADIPVLDASKITTGIFDTARIPALTGDVTSTAGTTTTSIASTVVTGKILTGYSVGTNTPIAATDTILQAFQKIQGQISARQDNSASQAANTVFAAPSASAGTPSFRLLVAADIPVLDASKITTGTMATARLGSGTASATTFLRGDSTWAAITASNVGGLAAIATSGSASDLIAGTVPAARMPAITGDATMAAGTTVTAIASTVVTGKVLTGYAVGTNSAITATDTILQAFQKIQGQISARQDSSVSQAANLVYASPNGSAGVPSFRSLVQADIPGLDGSKIVSGTVAAAYLGSGVPTSSTFLRGNNTWSVLNATDIPNLDWSKITTGKPTTLAGYGISSSDTLFDSKYILVSSYNQANGTPQLDATGKIPASLLPAASLGALQYQGAWNASTNSPALPAANTCKGWYYVVSVAGTYNSVAYAVKDWIVSNGTTWDKIDNTDLVTSVFGRLGDVTAQASDYSAFYPLLSGSYANPSWITALDGSKITTGTVATARLGSGSPTSANFLRGDGTWTAITAGNVGGLAAIATSGSASDLVAGTVPAARMPALTGDVTMTAGTTATSLANIITAGGPVGNGSTIPVISWDSKGRLTAVSSASITPASIGAQPAGSYASASHTHDKLVIGSGLPGRNIDTLYVGSSFEFTAYSIDGPTGTTPFGNSWTRVLEIGHGDSNWATQMAFHYFSDSVSFRRKDGGTWQSWKSFWHSGNLAFGTGASDMARGNHNHDGAYAKLTDNNTWTGTNTFAQDVTVNNSAILKVVDNDGHWMTLDVGLSGFVAPGSSGYSDAHTAQLKFNDATVIEYDNTFVGFRNLEVGQAKCFWAYEYLEAPIVYTPKLTTHSWDPNSGAMSISPYGNLSVGPSNASATASFGAGGGVIIGSGSTLALSAATDVTVNNGGLVSFTQPGKFTVTSSAAAIGAIKLYSTNAGSIVLSADGKDSNNTSINIGGAGNVIVSCGGTSQFGGAGTVNIGGGNNIFYSCPNGHDWSSANISMSLNASGLAINGLNNVFTIGNPTGTRYVQYSNESAIWYARPNTSTAFTQCGIGQNGNENMVVIWTNARVANNLEVNGTLTGGTIQSTRFVVTAEVVGSGGYTLTFGTFDGEVKSLAGDSGGPFTCNVTVPNGMKLIVRNAAGAKTTILPGGTFDTYGQSYLIVWNAKTATWTMMG